MSSKNLHDEPFDENTICKLEIFEEYAKAWLPTFIMQPHIDEIHIFDLFAGTGYDKKGVKGSPVRILDKIFEQKENLLKSNISIKVHFNEFEPNKKEQIKFDQLKKACSKIISNNEWANSHLSIKYYNEDFEKIFPSLLSTICEKPALVYLDQNGIRYLSDKYFLKLAETKQTDFLYFVSSSYFWRFGEKDEFRIHVDIDMDEVKKNGYKLIHRSVTDQLRKKLPSESQLKLYSFSIKKGSNIHGIIFGATNPRAVDKFLSIAWKRNHINGSANFDIDEDKKKGQLNLFSSNQLTKIESFQENVEKLVLDSKLTDNKKLLEYTYSQGHLPCHAAECMRKLKKDRMVDYEGSSPYVTYDNVFKKGNIVSYRVLEK